MLFRSRRKGGAAIGAVIHVDRFGTLITNLTREFVTAGSHIRVGPHDVGTLSRTFADVRSGQLVAFVGSGGTIEIAARDGSAARVVQQGVGTVVRIEPARAGSLPTESESAPPP